MKLIKPNEISSKVLTLIEESDQFVLFVSPYIKINKWFKLLNKINTLKERKLPFQFIIRDDENNKNSFDELKILNIPFIAIPNLHAKLYLNENEAIITSLNLLLNSEINSLEIGYKTETEKEYLEIIEFCKRYLKVDFENFAKNKIPKTQAAFNKESEVEVELELESKFQESNNFFAPSLYRKIKSDNSFNSVLLNSNGNIIAKINDQIEYFENGATNFHFAEKNQFVSFKEQFRDNINQELSDYRVYWNYNKINIYFPKGYSFNLDNVNVQDVLERKLFLIDRINWYLSQVI